MKALVLSGGDGTRLRPFSHSMPKQLVPVANKPVLVHCLENIRDIGIRDVGIIVGDNAGEVVRAIGDGAELGLTITYLRQDEPLGLAHCVVVAREFLGDDDFVMYLGDNVLTAGIAEPARAFAAHRPDAHLLLSRVADPRAYGVAEVDGDGRVTRLVEKSEQPPSELAITGVYFLTPAIHAAIDAITPSRRGELEITDALHRLATTGGTVTARECPGYWQDTGSVDGLLDANRAMLRELRTELAGRIDADTSVQGDVVIEPGAVVSRSRLVGPLVIGRDAVVDSSFIGPGTSLSPGCQVRDAAIADSILLEGAQVTGLKDLRRSVLGRWAQVRSARNLDRRRLIVGDHSRAEVIPVSAPRFNECSWAGRPPTDARSDALSDAPKVVS